MGWRLEMGFDKLSPNGFLGSHALRGRSVLGARFTTARKIAAKGDSGLTQAPFPTSAKSGTIAR